MALVKRAMEELGAKNATELADKLGYTGRNEDRKVRNWVEGMSSPNFDGTVRLLRALGLLNEPADGAPVARAPLPGSVEGMVAAILQLNLDNFAKVNSSLVALTARIERLEKRLSARSAQERQQGKQG